jgi:hypothetical protein
MKPHFFAFLLVFMALIFTACASPVADQPVVVESAPVVKEQPGQSAQALVSTWEQTVQVDEQGAIVMEVTPLNLNTQADMLEFDVAMNTHSVDLSMDLVKLAILTTDAGITVNATSWEAPSGGHHVSGKLLFPSSVDGKSILEGATNFTVQIRDVDASLRTFVWRVQ